MENHLSKLKVQNIYDLESETRGQASFERWRYERSLRLSSSFFKEIACRKKSTPCSKLVMRIVYGRDLCNAAMKYGLANEEIARKQHKLKAKLMMERETLEDNMSAMSLDVANHGKIMDVKELEQAIDGLKAADIKAVAGRVMKAKPAMASLGRLHATPHVDELL
ncbi:cytochrome b-c1 complex subunit 2, mitochondrial [Trichonephila clavipes]|nr:cytochrome b-c1 complex subunit 2, mitochondrial [Trichonephila clavipes]